MTARRVALLLAGVLVVYALLIVGDALALLRDGRPAVVLLGVGVLLLPLVAVPLVVRELRFGLATERLARDLAVQGWLPADELPRLPSGRVDLSAADEVFERRRTEVEAAPDDWAAWYALAVAYGDARDTQRGRAAMRHAIRLHDGGPPASAPATQP